MKEIFLICAAAVMLELLAAPSFAQSRPVSVPIRTELTPLTAVGLILSPGRIIQKAEAGVEKVKEGVWRISFTAQANELEKDSLVSAMIVSEDGSVAFGDLAPSAFKGSPELYASLPECQAPRMSVAKLQNQASVLESLVAVRSERRQILQESLANELQGELLEKAVRLERGFGLTREKELGSGLSPLELVDRLSRLIAAIKNHRASREVPPSADTPAAGTATPQ